MSNGEWAITIDPEPVVLSLSKDELNGHFSITEHYPTKIVLTLIFTAQFFIYEVFECNY